jgi:hypothetical protein
VLAASAVSHRASATSHICPWTEDSVDVQVWCGQSVPSCPRLPSDAHCKKACPGNATQPCGDSWELEVIEYTCGYLPPATAVTVSIEVLWSLWEGNKPTAFSPIPTERLQSELPPAEQAREDLQRGLARGWGSWLHSNLLALVLVFFALISPFGKRHLTALPIPPSFRPFLHLLLPFCPNARIVDRIHTHARGMLSALLLSLFVGRQSSMHEHNHL